MSVRPKVVVTHRVFGQVKQLLAEHCEVIANDSTDSWPPARLRELARDVDALLVFMPDTIDEPFLAACPRLKVIAAALKGYDNIDVSACTRRGTWVTVVPDLLSQPTAELALTLTLGLVRNLASGDRLIRSGEFHGWRPVFYGSSLVGKSVGIVGMGRLGHAFARMLAGFRVRIIYYDPVQLSPVQEAFLGMERAAWDDVLSQSDIIVLLVPLTEQTLHLINPQTLSKMKKGAYLVNVGRGSVVDEGAVAKALELGHLAGYAADVFEMEDLALAGHPQGVHPALLAHADRSLFTPHLGSAVAEIRLEIELAAARGILQGLKGERPQGAINEIQFSPVNS
jgi:phosphonate dehydrogenase